MVNILEGVQFRAPHLKFPHWNPNDPYLKEATYGVWQDVPDGMLTFSKGTQLRTKPKSQYRVSGWVVGTVWGPNTYGSKNEAMSVAAQRIDLGDSVKIELIKSPYSTQIGRDRKLQVKSAGKWVDFTMDSAFTLSSDYIFRTRPDYYYRITTLGSPIEGAIDFFDIEDLTKYVDNRIRTNGLNFQVNKVQYS